MTAPSRVVAIVQARLSSARFPGKVLAPLHGMPMIFFMLKRLERLKRVDAVILATSLDPSDDPLALAAHDAGIDCFRGSLDDVLARFHAAAQLAEADIVVRLTGDCPLIDPELVDSVIDLLISDGADYASNTAPPTYPDGLDVEAMTMATLTVAADEAELRSEREHVTLFIHSRPERFRLATVVGKADHSALRWTVDYPDDLKLVSALVAAIDGDPVEAGFEECLRAYKQVAGGGLLNDHARNEGLAKSLSED